jgi:hypothetical protein
MPPSSCLEGSHYSAGSVITAMPWRPLYRDIHYSWMTALGHLDRDTWALVRCLCLVVASAGEVLMTKTTFCLAWRRVRWDQGPARPHHLLPPPSPIKGDGRGAMRALGDFPLKTKLGILGHCRLLLQAEQPQGDGRSYALQPVQRLCRWRMSRWTRVQRADLLLGSAEGLFTSAWKHWRQLLMRMNNCTPVVYWSRLSIHKAGNFIYEVNISACCRAKPLVDC